MKRNTTLLLRAALALVAVVAATLLLWEPQLEGRNAHATLFEIYFRDPFLAYAYVASLPFFVGLWQAGRFLEHAGRGEERSPPAVRRMRVIRYCAIAIIGFVALGEVFIMLNESDDRAGGVFVGILISVASLVVAIAAGRIERALRKAS